MDTHARWCGLALMLALAPGLLAAPQVQTDVPPPVPGAKPVTMERI